MPPLTPPTEWVITLSLFHSHLLKKIDSSLGIHGLSFTELMVLHHLNAAPNKTLRRIDLAESVGLSASGVTRLLNPMEKIKLIQKEINPRDARVSLVKLSKTGERVFKEAFVSFEESANSLLQTLSPNQLDKLLELTKKLI